MGFKIKVPKPRIRIPIAPPGRRHKSEKDYDRKREKTSHKDPHLQTQKCPDCGHEMKWMEVDCEDCSGRAWIDQCENTIWSFVGTLGELKILQKRDEMSYLRFQRTLKTNPLDLVPVGNRLEEILI